MVTRSYLLRAGLVAVGASLIFLSLPSAARADDKASTVKLLDAGKKPRRALRYQLRAGAKETVKISTDMSMKMEMAGSALPETAIPTIEMEMAIGVEKKLSNREYRYEFSVTSATARKRAGVMDQMVTLVQQALDSAKGMSGTAIVDTRGFNRDMKVNMPAGLAPQMEQMMQGMNKGLDQMSAPFPAEAVGKGAKWQVRQVIEQGGMKLRQVLTFRLVALKGDTGTLEVSVVQTAKPQTITVSGMTAELIRYSGKGSGTSKFSLLKLVPTMTMKVKSEYAMKVGSYGEMKGQLDMAMSASSR